jgi:hypothetical protein
MCFRFILTDRLVNDARLLTPILIIKAIVLPIIVAIRYSYKKLAQCVHVFANEQNPAGAQAKIPKQQETNIHRYTSKKTQYQQARMSRGMKKPTAEGEASTAGDPVVPKKTKKTTDEIVAGTSNVPTEGKSPVPKKKKKKTVEVIVDSAGKSKKPKHIQKKPKIAKATTATMDHTNPTAALQNAMEKYAMEQLSNKAPPSSNRKPPPAATASPETHAKAPKSSKKQTTKAEGKEDQSITAKIKKKKRSATPEEDPPTKKKKSESTSNTVDFANLLSKVEFVEADKSEEEDENLSVEQLLRNAIRDVKTNPAFYDMEVKEEEKNEIGKLCSYIQDVEILRNEAQSNHSASKLPMWDFKASKPREMLHAMQSVNIWLIDFCVATNTAIGNDFNFTKMLAVYVGKLGRLYVCKAP